MDRKLVEGMEDALVDMPEGLTAVSMSIHAPTDFAPEGWVRVSIHTTDRLCFGSNAGPFAESYRDALAKWREIIPNDALVTAFDNAVQIFAARQAATPEPRHDSTGRG